MAIFGMLDTLRELDPHDYLTIVVDGENPSTDGSASKRDTLISQIRSYASRHLRCQLFVIDEKANLGFWGHEARNKYNVLAGDFVLHVDDDDAVTPGAIASIKRTCVDTSVLYVFQMRGRDGKLVWRRRDVITLGNVGTPCGLIPSAVNMKSHWGLRYGGDFDFYAGLVPHVRHVEFVERIIYNVSGAPAFLSDY